MAEHTPAGGPRSSPVLALHRAQPADPNASTTSPAEPGRVGFTFSEQDKRADFVAHYPELDALCERLGFGWDHTVADWCHGAGWVMLELARAAQPPPIRAGDDLGSASLAELVEHLLRCHHRPLRCELNRLSLMIRHLATVHPHQPDLQALAGGFSLLRDSLLVHLQQEEADAFPLCLELEALHHAPADAVEATKAEPLHFMAAGHLESGDDLARLAELARRAASTSDPDVALVSEALAAMARDLAVHTGIENEILLPAALFTCELLARHRPSRHAAAGSADDAG